MKSFALMLAIVCVGAAIRVDAAQAPASAAVIEPGPQQLPAWLQRGKFRFARFDGGPIEVQKTRRSAWGERFTPEEQRVLANLYDKHGYGQRMVDLLAQAHVNFVWVTYSVGFSWYDEAPQRAMVREITAMLHARGIKVAAYMDAHSIFWQSMFKDVPQSVRWLAFDPEGLPYRYSGGQDALRYIANLDDPGWVAYEEQRIGGIIDDGLDAIFFDNTASPAWSSNAAVAHFFTKIRKYIHDQKHSDIPLFTNFGLSPSRAELNRYMNFTFDEHWREPGVWNGEWDASNIRRTRYMRGIIPAWKPVITEYSVFHEGTRSTGFLKPRSERLSIAEAASFGSAYGWDMEGPLDAQLMARDPAALASWAAIGRANGFLASHQELYAGAQNVAPITVLLPDDFDPRFAWDNPAPLIDSLSKESVLYKLKIANQLQPGELDSTQGVIVPFYAQMSRAEQDMIRSYAQKGKSVYAFAQPKDLDGAPAQVSSAGIRQTIASDPAARKQVQAKLALLETGSTHIDITTGSHVLANVTSIIGGQKLAIHLLNYDPSPVHNLHVRLTLGHDFSRLAGSDLSVASPDSETPTIQGERWKNSTLDFTLPALDVYSVVVLGSK